MKITHEVRVYAEEQRTAALQLDQEVGQGMLAKAEEFKLQGAQLYHKV